MSIKKDKNLTAADPVIEIKNLDFSFGKTKVLLDVSLKVQSGDFLAILGPNGSGKTTLIKLILGLYSIKKGSIKLFNKRIENFSEWSKIGYVPQKATYFESNFPATVKEVVQMGLLSKKRFPKIITDQDEKKVFNALNRVDMENYRNKQIGELSGGQQQRVLIARAIVSNPEILFLDEPVTGVDMTTQNKFYDLLNELNQSGITIILVSHDIGRVTKYVSKVANLNQRLEFYGSHKDFCVWDKEHHHKVDSKHKLCLHTN